MGPWTTSIKLGKTDITFKVDTGADVTCISEEEYRKTEHKKLTKARRTLRGPGNAKLCVLGKFDCGLESNKCFSVQEVYVVRGLTQALLGHPAIQSLKIIDQVNLSSVHDSDQGSDYFRDKFPGLFKGLGETDWEYTIALDADAKPFSLNVPRRVPIPLLEKVKAELANQTS